ncbi:hypothetical protein D6C91_10560, partial [Aureobasidium pullulans]
TIFSKVAKPAAEPTPTTPDAKVKTKTTRKRGTPKGANRLATSTSGVGPVDVTYKNESFIKLPKDIRGRPLRYNLPPKHGDRGLISKVNIIEKAGTIKATKEYAREFKHRLAITILNKECATKARHILYGFRLNLYDDAYRLYLPPLAVILTAVRANSKPDKAAKVFFAEASRFAKDLVTTNRGRKEVVFKIITFGKHCFLIKDEDKLEE